MKIEAKNPARLQEWILIEAFKNGLARQGDVCSSAGNGRDGSDQFFITRHAVYQRYFKLPIEAFLRGAGNRAAFRRHLKLRMRSTAILCESVRRLVEDGLIHFPRRASGNKGKDDPLQAFATLICLTVEGVRKAESLLLTGLGQDSSGPTERTWPEPACRKPSPALPLLTS